MRFDQINPANEEMNFMIKYPKLVHWEEVIEYFHLPLDFIIQNRKYFAVSESTFWSNYVFNVKINPKEFLDAAIKNDIHIPWDILLTNHKLSMDLLNRIVSDVDNFKSASRNEIWYHISQNQELSEKFIEDHRNDVNWASIACCQKLSEDFIKRNLSSHGKGVLDSYKEELLKNQVMHYDLLDKYFKPFDFNSTLAMNPNCPMDVIDIFAEGDKDWKVISKYHVLTPEFIDKYINNDKLNLSTICFNKTLTTDLAKIILNKYNWLDWDELLQYNNDIFKELVPTLNKEQLELLAKKWEK